MALTRVFNNQMLQLLAFVSILLAGILFASQTMAAIIPKNLIVTAYAIIFGAMVWAYASHFIKPRHAAGRGAM